MRRLVIKVKTFIGTLYWYRYLRAKHRKWIVEKNPKIEMRQVYSKVFNREPNLEHPKDLIEKIYWMQLHSDTSLWTRCADKYAMRGYVKECGYGEYLPKNLGKWEDPADIDFNQLPDEFVLKTNNGCGTNLVVANKSRLNLNKTRKTLKRWLKIPFGWSGAQLHYTRIKPCIIAEELLHQSKDKESISPNSLVDYKVWCINGVPEAIWVAFNRHDVKFVNMSLFDTQWRQIPEHLHGIDTDKYNPEVIVPKPSCLDEMLKIASGLSKPFPQVRVDFYEINDKPVIGEMTFSSGYGYFTEEYYRYLGEKMIIKGLD